MIQDDKMTVLVKEMYAYLGDYKDAEGKGIDIAKIGFMIEAYCELYIKERLHKS